MNQAHGGHLVSRLLSDKDSDKLKVQISEYQTIDISSTLTDIVQNIGHGVLSPLTGFMTEDETNNVLDDMRLLSDVPWTIPIVFDVNQDNDFSVDDEVVLCLDGAPVAVLLVEDKFTLDKRYFSQQVFGTQDSEHPGVARTHTMEKTLLGGKLSVISSPPLNFEEVTLYPLDTRILFKTKRWRTIVAFQTRNPPHLGHEYVKKTALTFVDGIFINPLIGPKKQGDFRDEVILDAYRTLMKTYFLRENCVLSILRSPMYYAGPREAIHHAIMRKNFGCTHFIVGRDHAGVGKFYHPLAAQEIFDKFPDLEIIPLLFKSFFYCTKCRSIANEKTCPHPKSNHIDFSGTEIRRYFQEGRNPPESLMRREVAEMIASHPEPFVS